MKSKSFKKFIKISVIVVLCFTILGLLLGGINLVPSRFSNKSISFLTPDLTWDSRTSEVILRYGLPEDIGKVSDITGERDFYFNFDYDGKNVALCLSNRYFLNAPPHSYYFTIECNTPEEARAYFDECHKNIMDFHKADSDFQFEGTYINNDFEYENGDACSYSVTYENGVEKIQIWDDGKEIPLEDAHKVVTVETIENNYGVDGTCGTSYSLLYTKGSTSITLSAQIMY